MNKCKQVEGAPDIHQMRRVIEKIGFGNIVFLLDSLLSLTRDIPNNLDVLSCINNECEKVMREMLTVYVHRHTQGVADCEEEQQWENEGGNSGRKSH